MDTTIQYGGNQHSGINEYDLIRSLKDYLDVTLYSNIKRGSHNPAPDKEITSNKDLWNFIIRNEGYPNQVIKFLNFYLLEWIPLSPGLFFTEKATYIRGEVESHFKRESAYTADQRFIEFNPDEKSGMIRGGYGSLRLGTRLIRGEDKFILGLSSSAISHEGIPVIINQTLYNKIASNLKESGLVCVSLTGTLKILPPDNFGIKFNYSGDVPKYCIEAEDFEIVKARLASPRVSIAIIYNNRNVQWGSNYGHSFCTFKPDKLDKNLKLAVEWLSDYARRYSGDTEPKILGDFDEYFEHFHDVNFPISKTVKDNISIEEICKIFNSVNIPFEKVHNKILFLTSNPSDTEALRTGKEARDIEDGLRFANRKNYFDFKVKLAVRPGDLSRAILEENPQFLHFAGHGEYEGIILEDDDGNSKIVTTEALSSLFSLFGNIIKCVFLNSCYADFQAHEISKYIPFVIGMRGEVPDDTAITFATSFYEAIGAGRDIEFAFNYGLSNISLEELPGEKVPVLLKKPG